MKSHKIKYTIEFELPIKIEESELDLKRFPYLEALYEQATKIHLFYFQKKGESAYSMKSKNIKISREINVGDYII